MTCSILQPATALHAFSMHGGNSDPKSFYAYVRSKSKTKIKVGPLIDSSNMQVKEEEQMCEILNQSFSSVFTLEIPEGLVVLENRLNQENVASNLNKVLITEEIVYTKLCSFKSNKAHGDDGMGSLMLKELANELEGVLSIVYNRPIFESKTPHDLKIANVTPIFKNGEKCYAGNYRSVSLTSHVCTILESIIKDSIINHINLNNLLNM